tara:strand:+ start:658 stop:822 length:165 start_codon:yes stop_codon:yes gene_type:complete
MSGFYINKNKDRVLVVKKRAVDYTDKFENFLAVVMVMLVTTAIFRTILQAVSSF